MARYKQIFSILFLIILCGATALFRSPEALAADPAPLSASVEELLKKGDYDKALGQLQKAHDMFPLDLAVTQNLTIVHGLIGRRQLERKQYDEAAASFEQARELDPDNPEYLLGRGIALYLGKHYDDALFALGQARLFGGDTANVLFFIGKVYYDTGNLEGALDAWKKGMALDPTNTELRALVDKTNREMAVEGRMGKDTSSRFDISYDVATEGRFANEVLDILETAYSRVGADFDHYPEARIPVIIYTQKDFHTTTSGPDWSGGIYDGKIRLPIGGVREITPQLRAVLHHEYTHVIIRELTKGNCPTWLNEGLAQVEERKEFSPTWHKTGESAVLPMTVLEGSFLSLGSREAKLAYLQSYAMADSLIAAYGWHKIREILVNLGRGMTIGNAVTQAMKDYGIGYPEVLQEVRTKLKKELATE